MKLSTTAELTCFIVILSVNMLSIMIPFLQVKLFCQSLYTNKEWLVWYKNQLTVSGLLGKTGVYWQSLKKVNPPCQVSCSSEHPKT
jgi:hypothetical protein